jgi:hypothetical protein
VYANIPKKPTGRWTVFLSSANEIAAKGESVSQGRKVIQ